MLTHLHNDTILYLLYYYILYFDLKTVYLNIEKFSIGLIIDKHTVITQLDCCRYNYYYDIKPEVCLEYSPSYCPFLP